MKVSPAFAVLVPIFAALASGSYAQGSGKSPDLGSFDPNQAFCQRQTFSLEETAEAAPWLDYLGGLREARTIAPELDCPSTTVRALYNVVASQNEDEAKAKRQAVLGFYVALAMTNDSAERAVDQDGSFRYRNDVTLAGFVWLLCPGKGDAQMSCVRTVIEEFPAEFLGSSPVFCDFAASSRQADVEWPRTMVELPLTCLNQPAGRERSITRWLSQLEAIVR